MNYYNVVQLLGSCNAVSDNLKNVQLYTPLESFLMLTLSHLKQKKIIILGHKIIDLNLMRIK